MKDVSQACREVLDTADPLTKVRTARRVARDWRLGRIGWDFGATMPDRPARTDRPPLLPPSQMPRRGGGSDRNRIAMLHALAHIEYVAIDLAFDLIGRFGAGFPRGFIDSWMKVGAEEAMHFYLVERRLRQLGASYGDLPAHDGLWEAAEQTAGDALARLAIVPMVLEARGLDVTPAMIARFHSTGDRSSARILTRIADDEIGHVAAGVEWFGHLCAVQRFEPGAAWVRLVRLYFRGNLKAPFNDSARIRAGLTKELYESLAAPHDAPHKDTSAQQGGNPDGG